MRKIIITEEQLEALREDATTDDVPVINATAEDTADVASKGEDMVKQVKSQGGTNVKIKVTPKTAPSGAVEVSGQGESAREQFQDAVESVTKSGMNKDKVSYTVTLGADGMPTQNEGRVFSKALLEQIRVHNLKKHCVCHTKKSLTESLTKKNSYSDLMQTLEKITGQAQYHMEAALKDFTIEVAHMFQDLNTAIELVENLCKEYGVEIKPNISVNTYTDELSATFQINYAVPYNSDDVYEDFEDRLYVRSPYISIWVNEVDDETIDVRIEGELPELPLKSTEE